MGTNGIRAMQVLVMFGFLCVFHRVESVQAERRQQRNHPRILSLTYSLSLDDTEAKQTEEADGEVISRKGWNPSLENKSSNSISFLWEWLFLENSTESAHDFRDLLFRRHSIGRHRSTVIEINPQLDAPHITNENGDFIGRTSFLSDWLPARKEEFHNNGTPKKISKEHDCALRTLVYEKGTELFPQRGKFKTLFDALQLHVCQGVSKPETMDEWVPPYFAERMEEQNATIFVDQRLDLGENMVGTRDGSMERPFRTLKEAIRQVRSKGTTVMLREGIYFIDETIQISGRDNDALHGLTIRNYRGERAILTGSQKLKSISKGSWKLYDKKKNIWFTELSPELNETTKFTGLRRGKARCIRAKFPNGHPEQSGSKFNSDDPAMGHGGYVEGWFTGPTDWFPDRRGNDAEEIVIIADDWPSVEWPMHQPGGPDDWTGEGDWGEFHIGLGGTCDDVHPPAGYWCAKKPPRKINSHRSPNGFNWEHQLERGDSYTNVENNAVVVAWRGGGRWYTWIWEVEKWFPSNKTGYFKPGTGNQGGEGENHASEWYIENVFEELDDANEWYYDDRTNRLYYVFNHTELPGDDEWRATRTKVLLNISHVDDMSIQGVEIRDSALTWLDEHGLPSGGDWALQRSGAIVVENTNRFILSNSLMERIDGNGIMLNGYNREALITDNEFAWIGGTAIGSWGYTGTCLNENCTKSLPWKIGPDGRGGEQPRGTKVIHNIFRELGIFQKQASAYFHAKSGFAVVARNLMMNGPRALINFNDGFLGGDEIYNNVMLNAVRESGDHGPFNSWDRVPYIHAHTRLQSNGWNETYSTKPTIIPNTRHIHNNLVLGTYSTQEGFDTDDGSSYYEMYENVLIYGYAGLKADFGGHDHSSHDELFVFIDLCYGTGPFLTFANNTCILRTQSDDGYPSTCRIDNTMVVRNNTVATPNGETHVCGMTLTEWVARGNDPGTHSIKWPPMEKIVERARSMFDFS